MLHICWLARNIDVEFRPQRRLQVASVDGVQVAQLSEELGDTRQSFLSEVVDESVAAAVAGESAAVAVVDEIVVD